MNVSEISPSQLGQQKIVNVANMTEKNRNPAASNRHPGADAGQAKKHKKAQKAVVHKYQ